jgi:Raf kinase inhibitor-like YbhB/YbcL family protein
MTVSKAFFASCDGPDLSPPLSWTGTPALTKSFALIVDDPDAPARTWVHWVLYDIPATARELAQDVPSKNKVPGDGRARPRPRRADGTVSAEVTGDGAGC